MNKGTLNGHARMTTSSEVVEFLLRHPKVDKIKFGRMSLSSGWYLAFWSSLQQQGYGSTVLADDEFEKLRRTADGVVSFEHTTQIVAVPL